MLSAWNGGNQMINITYGSREPPSLTVCGHSGYSTKGTDIVCASVSTLFLTLANALSEYTNDLLSVRTEPGDGAIIWRGNISYKARTLLDGTLLGLRMISEEYPDYVKFDIA